MSIRKPAFSKGFALSDNQRSESGAWVFIGSWGAARKMGACGSHRMLCVPPGEDPLQFDWSQLRGEHVTMWLYCDIDIVQLVVCLRAAGVKDIAIFDRATGELHLAHSAETEAAIRSLQEVA